MGVQIYLALISCDLGCFKDDLRQLIDHSHNHATLRENLWNLEAPAIPYLGVFLKDAFQADELLRISKLQKVSPKQMQLLFNVYDRLNLFRMTNYAKRIQRNAMIANYIQRQL